jgi:hypothetical protein
MPGDTREIRRSILPVRLVRARPRLFISLGVSVAIAAILSAVTTWRLSPRLRPHRQRPYGPGLSHDGGLDVHDIRRRAAGQVMASRHAHSDSRSGPGQPSPPSSRSQQH